MRGLARTATTLAGALVVTALAVPAYAQTPTPTPTTTPTTTATATAARPTAVPTTSMPRETSLTVQPGGCGDINGVSTEFARVRATYDGDFWISASGMESRIGPFSNVYDSGFPVKPGSLEVRLVPVDGTQGVSRVVNIPDVCGKPGEPPTSSPTPIATPTRRPSPTPTTEAPVTKKVTAKYECGAATFTNPLDVPVWVTYGPAQSDAGIKTAKIIAGRSLQVDSTEKQFGWTARTEDGTDVGHLYLPGEDLSCDEPDDSAPVRQRPAGTNPSNGSRGLANTGI